MFSFHYFSMNLKRRGRISSIETRAVRKPRRRKHQLGGPLSSVAGAGRRPPCAGHWPGRPQPGILGSHPAGGEASRGLPSSRGQARNAVALGLPRGGRAARGPTCAGWGSGLPHGGAHRGHPGAQAPTPHELWVRRSRAAATWSRDNPEVSRSRKKERSRAGKRGGRSGTPRPRRALPGDARPPACAGGGRIV